MRPVVCMGLAGLVLGAWGAACDVDRPWTLQAPRTEVRERVPGIYWIEAENFDDYGEWLLDTQFAHKMGSGYLLAAGVGRPRASARTRFRLATPGRYRVCARTKDWVPQHHPGVFALVVNGRRLTKTLGASGRDWSWETAGEVDLSAGPVDLELVDLSGFYARCDAVVLVRDGGHALPDAGEELAALRARCVGEPTQIADGGAYDVVVVGGGPAGVPAAIAAARHGAKVALVQDRPVLGGNVSSELGVLLNGASDHPGYREGGIIEEAVLAKAAEARGGKLSFSRVFARMAAAETNLSVRLGARVESVEKAGERIAAVLTRDPLTGVRARIRGRIFVDATGDGWVGYFAGAQAMYGREGTSEYGESYAPDEPDAFTMSGCLLGGYGLPRMVETDVAAPFVTPDWAWPLPKGFYRKPDGLRFKWWLEHPGDLDDCNDPELARDALLRIFFAYWGWLKNETPDVAIREMAARHDLVSLPYMNGRREGRRLKGDYIFTERDALAAKDPDDAIGHTGWPLDTHDPLGVNNPTGNGSWRKKSPDLPHPVGISYRILYSVNVPNLFMAGRDVSCSHVGLGTLRVAATCAVTGQAAGTAAAGCIRTGLLPREYGRRHICELQRSLQKDDQYIPGRAFEDPANLANGATATATSEDGKNVAANVLDGWARTLPAEKGTTPVRKVVEDTGFGYVSHPPLGVSHEWISDPSAGLPQVLTVTLARPAEASQVRVTFDSDFYLEPRWVLHDVPKTLVRAYDVEVSADGRVWRTVAKVTSNCRRLAVHDFARQWVAAVRITVRETYGDPSARIFAVGLWEKES